MVEALSDLIERATYDAAGDGEVAAGLGDKMIEITRNFWSDYSRIAIDTVGALPDLACEACGGDTQQSRPVTLAWLLGQPAIKTLDDVGDGETKAGDIGILTNAATGLFQVAHMAIEEISEDNTRLRVSNAFKRCVLGVCVGQHVDMMAFQNGEYPDPDTWLQIADAKTGTLFAFPVWAGALVAGADESALSNYREFGTNLGVLIQAMDDLTDAWKLAGDISSGSVNLAVCYALLVLEGKGRERLMALIQRAGQNDADAEAQAQQMLIDAAAQHYVLTVIQAYRQRALEALQRAKPISGQPLAELVNKLVASVVPSS